MDRCLLNDVDLVREESEEWKDKYIEKKTRKSKLRQAKNILENDLLI